MLKHAKNFLFVLAFLSFLGCNPSKPETPIPATKKTTQTFTIPNSLSIEGDFDGDGKEDIVRQFLADSIGKPVSQVMNTDTWDEEIMHYSKQGYHPILVLNKKNSDTLTFSASKGLYCLINIGDINKDKKDEIALVADLLDYSRVNTCRIYSLCNNKWTEMTSFIIHEDAFDWKTGEQYPVFKEIKDFLEYHNGKWVFKDYHNNDYSNIDDVGKMKPLTVPSCKK